MNMVFIRPFAVVGCLLLVGCQTVRYEYELPATEAGKQCIVQCRAIRETCRVNAEQIAQAEKSSCESRSDLDYSLCMSDAVSKEEKSECFRQKDSCFIMSSAGFCNSDYDRCYVLCGGTVTKVTS